MASPSKSTIRGKLARSRLDPKSVQRELMHEDIDLAKLLVYLKSKIKFDVAERVTEIKVRRTIEGASVVTVELDDHDRSVLRSGTLNNKLDINIDGLWFRLAKVEKSVEGDRLTLVFEDREIAVMRTYSKLKIARRARATRAEFVLNLVREVKEFKIPVVIPELHKIQAIEEKDDEPGDWETVVGRTTGIPEQTGGNAYIPGVTDFPTGGDDYIPGVTDFPGPSVRARQLAENLRVKGAKATRQQVKNANTIISVGRSMNVPRKLLVCAIMTAITESRLINNPGGDLDSVGLFQQRGNGAWGTLRDRMDPATSSRMFYLAALKVHASDRTMPYYLLCADVQRPREDLRSKYDDYRTEAERFVIAYGVPGTDVETDAASANNSWSPNSDSGDYLFYRGDPQDGGKTWKPETSWAAIQRMADEVAWRAFFVSGTFYFMAEDELFKSKPLMTIREFQNGVEGIGGDYDSGKKVATITLLARAGRWSAPVGSVVVLRDMGPWNGRWLITDFERSLFDSKAEITLKKPKPRLPEPLENDLGDTPGGWASPNLPGDNTPGTVGIGRYKSPLPFADLESVIISTPEQHATRPFGNWQSDQAYDLKAAPGLPVYAVISGVITRLNLANVFTHEGSVFGAQITLQGDDGNTWWMTHIEHVPSNIVVGGRVFAGQKIGEITLWASSPQGSHLHIACDQRMALDALVRGSR